MLLALALAGSVIVALGVGAVSVSPAESLRLVGWKLGLLDRPGVPPSTEVILFALRLPRVLLAAFVGAALATSGAVFQGLFRNPLADPAIVGVSSGAALGAIAVIVLGGAGILGGTAITVAAFAGALLTALLVYRLARVGPSVHVATLLLAGVAVAAVVSAAISIVMSLSGEQIRSIYFWLLGGLGARGWRSIAIVAPPILIAVVGAWLVAGDLNLVALGEERAAQLGVDLDRFKRRSTALGALLAACAVSVAGVIGFVGLMTPHVLRLIVGADHRRLLPAVALAGPTFLILADLVARTAIAPEELPVGVVTALLGGPFFLWLLRRERRRAAGVA
ncbi:MAG TPA: iron chelate uptake ABC transporter family permease subunit [Actinomycetota bacterium]|nr:iron chelate uptake ABC transporter family permease subunit [Actinomycetota bacterium]